MVFLGSTLAAGTFGPVSVSIILRLEVMRMIEKIHIPGGHFLRSRRSVCKPTDCPVSCKLGCIFGNQRQIGSFRKEGGVQQLIVLVIEPDTVEAVYMEGEVQIHHMILIRHIQEQVVNGSETGAELLLNFFHGNSLCDSRLECAFTRVPV